MISASGRSRIWILPSSCKSHLLYIGAHWITKWRNQGNFYTDAGETCTEKQGYVSPHCMLQYRVWEWTCHWISCLLILRICPSAGDWVADLLNKPPCWQTWRLSRQNMEWAGHWLADPSTHSMISRFPAKHSALEGQGALWFLSLLRPKRGTGSREGWPGMKDKASGLRLSGE